MHPPPCTAITAAAQQFRQIMTPLTVMVEVALWSAILHHMCMQSISNILSPSVVEARQEGTLSAGGIVNKCDTEPNPAFHLFPIQGP